MNATENLCRILDENKIEYKRSKHEPVKTSEEAANMRGVELRTGVKALLLKTAERKFIMVLVPANKKVDLEKMAQLEKTKKVSLASQSEVLEETGCEIGGVPPFGFAKNGQDNKIKTYMDKEILGIETVNFNAGDRKVSVSMKGADLGKVVYYIGF